MKKKHILIIILTNLLIILLTTKNNLFGSTMDFLNQHIIFPEYLRNTFYETGKIIPKLAINLGAGQNIYNIAYYGLLNPIILISYMLPFIKMITYIIISNIILLIISNILLYKFLNTKFDNKISLILTLLFTLSGPLIFQFHRHFMFVNYMPFLILSLINIDKNKKINLIIDIFLIIMTSFYYSIPSILTIIIYYIYKNYSTLKIKEIIKFLICIITSIMCSMILILPTFITLITNRTGNENINIIKLLIPSINIDNITYGAYSIGLTSIAIISLIYLLMTKKKKNIFLFTSLSITSFFPISLYLLNGGLYLRSKVLIPFLPLFVLALGIFIKDLFDNKIDIKKLLKYLTISIIIILIQCHVPIFYLDIIFMIILILLYNKTQNKKIFILPLLALNIIICLFLNNSETYINKKYYQTLTTPIPKIETNYRTINLNNTNETINKIYNSNYYTTSIYSSTINKYYSNLYHNIFKINNPYINNLEIGATNNVLFNKYLSVKYIISDDELSYPYQKIENNLYELETTNIGYVTPNKVNKKYYDTLTYPYNLDILLNYIIDEKSNNKPTSNIKKINLEYTYDLGKNITIQGNTLKVQEDDKIIVHLKENLQNKILFINIYGQEEQGENISMTINGQTNLLTNKKWLYPNHNNTFNYCLNNVQNTLEILLTKGTYKIDNIETYILDDIKLDKVDELNIKTMNTETIKGNINVTKDGTFILKIPYDKGFDIKVNGNNQDYRLINDTFIGFDLKKGNYEIEITYNPPCYKIGATLSLIGIVLFIGEIIYKKYKM